MQEVNQGFLLEGKLPRSGWRSLRYFDFSRSPSVAYGASSLPEGAFGLFRNFVCFFLTTSDLIKDTKAIIILSNSQALLTNRQKCGKIYPSHNLIFIRVSGKLTLVKGVSFFLIPTNTGERLCDNNEGTLFRCVPLWGALFIC